MPALPLLVQMSWMDLSNQRFLPDAMPLRDRGLVLVQAEQHRPALEHLQGPLRRCAADTQELLPRRSHRIRDRESRA